MEIIRLGGRERTNIRPSVEITDLATVSFQTHKLPDQSMSIWLMTLEKNKEVLPWFSYSAAIDSDIEELNDNWSVRNPQNLFDALFLQQIQLLAGRHFYVVFPGSVKSNGWTNLKEEDQRTFLRGQSCIYHLEGMLSKKMNINWVPFYQPQSLVKDPNYKSLWRMFVEKQDENDSTNCLSFFSLSDPTKLPEVTNLLIKQDENRSEKLSELVDWFGVYSSPLKESYSGMSAIYTKNADIMEKFKKIENTLTKQYEQAKADLIKSNHPQTANKILSRHILL